MDTKHFKYKFNDNGFMRKEQTKKMYKEILLLVIFAAMMFFVGYVARETVILYVFLLFGVAILLYILFCIRSMIKISKMACIFNFSTKSMTYDKQKDIVQNQAGLNTIDISEFDSIIYTCTLNTRRYEGVGSAQARAKEKYPLAIEIEEKVVEVFPLNTINLAPEHLINSTSRLFRLYADVGFYLYNEKTNKMIYLMNANINKLEEVYEYVVKTVQPKKMLSIDIEDKKLVYIETKLNS